MSRIHALLLFSALQLFYSLHGNEDARRLTFESGHNRVQILELFTSQGCSSCPPAERWLNQYVDHPGLWTEIIPVVFHVDYWDRLGWKDPFASKQNTQRQYQYSKNGDIRSVCTPCFVSNGKEWREWFGGGSLPQSKEVVGNLKGEIRNGFLYVHYSDTKPLDLNRVILGFDLHTDVRKGENRGKNLEQQFVVLNHQTSFSKTGEWSVNLPNIDTSRARRFAIAIWVADRDELPPLQATGTWLDKARFP